MGENMFIFLSTIVTVTPRALAFSVKYRDNNEKKDPALRKLEEEKEMQAKWEFMKRCNR